MRPFFVRIVAAPHEAIDADGPSAASMSAGVGWLAPT
jgi:hypothetical protein